MVSRRQSFTPQDQRTPARVNHDEVRPCLQRPYRHIPPQQVIILQLLLQTLSQPLLAARHARQATAQRRYQYRHYLTPCIYWYLCTEFIALLANDELTPAGLPALWGGLGQVF